MRPPWVDDHTSGGRVCDNGERGGTDELVADRVHFGLDLAWDVYFAMGLALFAISAFCHPRFGRALGASGLALALALVVVNLATFPDPPAASGWLDVGPFAAIWYLVVTARVFASLRWAEERL